MNNPSDTLAATAAMVSTVNSSHALSRIAVMEPRMFGVMEPVSGC